MSRTVAVIGGGMAGLAAAYRCHQQRWEVTLFEAHRGQGLDAHRLEVDGGYLDVPLRVMSPGIWASVLKLADEAGVQTFPVRTYVSCNWTDRKTWFRSSRLPFTNWPIMGSWRYLNRQSLMLAVELQRLRQAINRHDDQPGVWTLADFLEAEHFNPLFWRGLILPLLTTVCTCEEHHLMDWPALQIMGLLDKILQSRKLVRLQGGTRALVQALSKKLRGYYGSPVVTVAEHNGKVNVKNARGDGGLFDCVIVATQANHLDFLQGEPYEQEKKVLTNIPFANGELIVHRDSRLMPLRNNDWTALNFSMDKNLKNHCFTVWTNRIEPSLKTAPPLFQSWNPVHSIDDDKIVSRTSLQRAVVNKHTAEVLSQLARWHQQEQRKVFYCGAWAHEGVPLLETAVQSAESVANLLGDGHEQNS